MGGVATSRRSGARPGRRTVGPCPDDGQAEQGCEVAAEHGDATYGVRPGGVVWGAKVAEGVRWIGRTLPATWASSGLTRPGSPQNSPTALGMPRTRRRSLPGRSIRSGGGTRTHNLRINRTSPRLRGHPPTYADVAFSL